MPVKKPLVIVTRKLPEAVETRMRELFDARLNLDDKADDPGGAGRGDSQCRCPGPTITDRIDAALIAKAGPNLKLIANFGAGVDNIDVAAATDKGIAVTNTPGVLTEDTADMTMALILAVPRRLVEGVSAMQEEKFTGWAPSWMLGNRLQGKRLGIVGMGRIGQAVARRAKAFGLQIHYHNRKQVAPEIEQELEADLLGQSGSDAGAHGHRVGELPAHAGDLSSSIGPAAEADEAVRLYRQHRARRGDRRELHGADAGKGRAVGRGPGRVRE
jgi:glyoxylate reductase